MKKAHILVQFRDLWIVRMLLLRSFWNIFCLRVAVLFGNARAFKCMFWSTCWAELRKICLIMCASWETMINWLNQKYQTLCEVRWENNNPTLKVPLWSQTDLQIGTCVREKRKGFRGETLPWSMVSCLKRPSYEQFLEVLEARPWRFMAHFKASPWYELLELWGHGVQEFDLWRWAQVWINEEFFSLGNGSPWRTERGKRIARSQTLQLISLSSTSPIVSWLFPSKTNQQVRRGEPIELSLTLRKVTSALVAYDFRESLSPWFVIFSSCYHHELKRLLWTCVVPAWAHMIRNTNPKNDLMEKEEEKQDEKKKKKKKKVHCFFHFSITAMERTIEEECSGRVSSLVSPGTRFIIFVCRRKVWWKGKLVVIKLGLPLNRRRHRGKMFRNYNCLIILHIVHTQAKQTRRIVAFLLIWTIDMVDKDGSLSFRVPLSAFACQRLIHQAWSFLMNTRR